MSENSKFREKYLHKNVPGAASVQGRKSKFWHNTPNRWLRKVRKFHGANANGFSYRLEKPQGADLAPYHYLTGLTLLLVGFLENVNWWGGGRFGPRQILRTNRPISMDKRHSIPLIVNFRITIKSRKLGVLETKVPKISQFSPITKIAITSLFLVRF